MTTTTNNKQIAAATAIPTIPAKPMPEVPGTGVAGGVESTDDEGTAGVEVEEETAEAEVGEETAGAVVDEEVAGNEVEGTATTVDEEEGGAETEVEVACTEDKTAAEEEFTVNEGVGISDPVTNSSDDVGVVSGVMGTPTDVTVELSSK